MSLTRKPRGGCDRVFLSRFILLTVLAAWRTGYVPSGPPCVRVCCRGVCTYTLERGTVQSFSNTSFHYGYQIFGQKVLNRAANRLFVHVFGRAPLQVADLVGVPIVQ